MVEKKENSKKKEYKGGRKKAGTKFVVFSMNEEFPVFCGTFVRGRKFVVCDWKNETKIFGKESSGIRLP